MLADGAASRFRWSVGGWTNMVTKARDRHLPTRADQTALIWEAEKGMVCSFAYAELAREVNCCAKMLKWLGIRKGDTRTIKEETLLTRVGA